MAEFYLTQTGEETQEALNQVMPNKDDIATEVQARIDGDAAVTQHCNEAVAAENERALGVEADLLQHCNAAVAAENERALGVEANLQQQINEIVGGDATVTLTATSQQTGTGNVFVGVENTINLRATCNKNATEISITGGNISSPIKGSGQSLNGTDTLTPATPGTTTYTAAFTISGQPRTATRSITAVYPIYFGAGMEQTDVLGVDACKATARTTPDGTYNVTVSDSPKYIWFFVPDGMPQITSAKMNGFDFPLEAQPDATEGGVTYKVYRTQKTQEEGTYSIIINPVN